MFDESMFTIECCRNDIKESWMDYDLYKKTKSFK